MYFEALASGGGSDWYYTILMKAPLGAKITVDDGDEEIEATGAGIETLIGVPVHNASSTYTISVEMNGLTAPTSSITTPATSGGISTVVEVPFAKISMTYDDEFRGQPLTITDGTHTPSTAPVLPAIGNTIDIYVPYTGNWTLEATDPVSGNTFNSSPNPVPVTSLDQTINVGLYVIPDGKTVLPVNDIETWLLCADIKDVSYTTLAEVLADEDVLRRLLTDDNANDYLVRSKEWIKQVKVPTLTENSSSVIGTSSSTSYPAWKAFDGDDTTQASVSDAGGGNTYAIGYDFGEQVTINKFMVLTRDVTSFKIQCTDDLSGSWTDVDTTTGISTGSNITTEKNITPTTARYWRLSPTGTSGTGYIYTLQFYGGEPGITESETAMSYIGADDYASDTLLDDGDWSKALCESEYFESVLNAKVPTMTSNTTPEGVVTETGHYGDYAGWKVFDGSTATTSMWNDYTKNPAWVAYQFTKRVKVFLATIIDKASSGVSQYKIQGSNDNFVSDINDLYIGTNWVSGGSMSAILTDVGEYDSYRLLLTLTNEQNIYELQFYGRQEAGVQTWLKVAGISKPYTTLSEVLDDPETLAALMSNHDAVDYLVTIKSWITDITSNKMAMLFIGGSNYAADTLLGDADWTEGIVKSDYFESVLNFKNPTMIDDTHPSGEAYASASYATLRPYKAFDDDMSTYWQCSSAAATANDSLAYKFDNPVKICGYYKKSSVPMSLEASNDPSGDGWTTLINTASDDTREYVDVNDVAYSNYRLKSTGSSVAATYVNEFRVYGREDVTEGVHIFSAANDTIYDQNNQVIGTTDDSGHVVVSKTNLPNGTYTLRSTVAKDPDNLSNDFTKLVKVTDSTSAIMLMPDNALYWYGLKINVEAPLKSNGWGFGTKDVDWNIQNTSLSVQESTEQYGGWSTNQSVELPEGSVINGLFENSRTQVNASLDIFAQKSAASGTPTWTFAGFAAANSIEHRRYVLPSDAAGFPTFRISRSYTYTITMHAFWLDKHNPSANFFGAANDLVYYISGGVHVPVCKTNAFGEAKVELDKVPSGVTLYSSVAKDPNNLSNAYSKVFAPSNGKFYMMPCSDDNMVYWFGYKGNYATSIGSNSTVTDKGNSVYPSAAANQYAYVYNKRPVTAPSIVKSIISNGTLSTYGLGMQTNNVIPTASCGAYTKSATGVMTLIDNTTVVDYGPLTPNIYNAVGGFNGRSGDIYALWFE